MKKAVTFSIIISIVAMTVYFFLNRDIKIKNMPPKNDKIIIFGDSLAEGVGSSQGNDLASRLEKNLGKKVFNYGKSGDTTRDALERVTEVSVENAGIVVVILGGNDVLQKIPKEETFVNLENIIKTIQNTGAIVVVVGVRSGLIGDGRGDEYEMISKKTGSLYISDILKDIFGDTRYMSDAIHPNNAGYEIIEKRFSPILKKLYR